MKKEKTGKKDIYLIGIKGVGMTMLAQFLAEQGYRISGSDIEDSFMTDKVLRKEKIKVLSPFSEKNIPARPGMIIHSSAFNGKNNPEMAYIEKHRPLFKGVPIMSYAEALGQTFNRYRGIAVCGSHGKTTTSAWLGYVLMKAGKSPNVLVGSRVPQFGGSSLKGKSDLFVAEVDEYQNKLRYFQPHGVVLNNIDYDHPDYFKDEAAYAKVFADFVRKIPASGFLIMNARDKESRRIRKYCRSRRVRSYDVVSGAKLFVDADHESDADYIAYDLEMKKGYQSFKVAYREISEGRRVRSESVFGLGKFKIKLWGEHNAMNALAVIAACREIGLPLEEIRKGLASFSGTERRAQVIGKYHGATIIDDYAHHPTEIKATLAGLRSRYPEKKLVTVFHPHTFTRTKALFGDFARSFADSDELLVLDIYGSAREKQGGVSSRQLVAAVTRANKAAKISQPARYIGTMPEASAYLRRHLSSGDVLVLMGAGDVFRIGQELIK